MSNPTPTKAVAVVTGNSMLTDTGRFEHSYRVAKVFAGSQLVPKHLQGKVEDIMIALNIADRLNEDPLTVMQSIYIVSGKAGWSSSYMIARINQSGLVRGRITWDVVGAGKDLVVTAKATLADTGEVVTATSSMQMAIAEGWVSNKKYQTMPEQMLRFRSAAMLQRLYFPEVMLGMATAEEIADDPAPAQPRDITPRSAAAALDAFAAAEPAAPPAPPVEANDVPEDGPNVFERDDAAKVAELKARTGVVAEEPVTIDAETGEIIEQGDGEAFDPADYVASAIKALQGMTSAEEVAGATAEVKKQLASYPKQLGEWNSARFAKLSIIATAGKKKGG